MTGALLVAAIFVVIVFITHASIVPMEVSVINSDDCLSMYVITDIHYMSENLYTEDELFMKYVNNGDKLFNCTEFFMDALINDIEVNKPDVIVFAGDLTNSGSKISHEDLSKKLMLIKSLGTQVYVVPGNHDINNENAIYFSNNEAYWADYISQEDFVNIYNEFGYKDAATRDDESLSYLVKPSDDLWIAMIDTTLDYPRQGGAISDKTLDWIEECSTMAKNDNAELIVVMHHNLLDHSMVIYENYTINNNNRVLNTFHNCGIEVVLTGHIHLQDIKSNYNSVTDTTIYDIATSGLSVFPHQYGHLIFSPVSGYKYVTNKLDIEKYAAENNITDEKYINFNEYSEGFFVDTCCKGHRERIMRLDGLSDRQKGQMIITATGLNKLFFSGYRNEALCKYIDSEGYKLINELESCFLKYYFLEMFNDERTNNNHLIIPY